MSGKAHEDEEPIDVTIFNIDHLKLPENDEAISNLTFELEDALRDMKIQKAKTSALRSSFDLLIDELLEKKIEQVDKDQERIFQELISSNAIK